MGAKEGTDPKILELVSSIENKPSCENYERMVSGMMYDPLDPIFNQDRHRARCLARDFNEIDHRQNTLQEVGKKKEEILQHLLDKFGEQSFIEAPLLVDYGCNVIFNSKSFANFNLTILDVGLVTIGNCVQLGPNVSIYSAAQNTSILSRMKCEEYGLPATIEDDCWIGGGTIILAGVTIGSGTTIGAGFIVTKSLPPHSVAVGNLARVTKKVRTLEKEMVISNKCIKE
ncbi:nodulation protein L [Colletotrichum paranaense]|uniref:Nodulation protein L n=2 Tax=Colletotrichum acutatum species complex TaxID=2707335 RepID=A0AAI9TX36_9PEZI|nr:nodulation protein L [Colletotrichum paranaense]KAK1447461.1 nodulation protein L [Colletotrichum melonis]KAK1544045.1 nodulation protein L [Colletotrichum paranaense]